MPERRIIFINNQRVLLYDKGASRRDLLRIYNATNPPGEDAAFEKESKRLNEFFDSAIANGDYIQEGDRRLVKDPVEGRWWSISSLRRGRR